MNGKEVGKLTTKTTNTQTASIKHINVTENFNLFTNCNNLIRRSCLENFKFLQKVLFC